jgi:hypothetical protein
MSSLTLSSTTTSTVKGTVKTASWLTVAPCRWPEPELSNGASHSSLDLLGKHKCWSLRENSPAHLMWKDLSKTIWSLLDEQIQHLDAGSSDLLFQIFMVGRQAAKTSPTVVFCSKNGALRKRAMKLVEKKVILGNHPGVKVAHSSRMPRLLALEDAMSLLNLPEGIYAEGPLDSCGVSIYIVADGSSPRRATIGGFVCICSEYYGLTTAHAFAKPEPTCLEEGSEVDFGFGDLGEPDDSSDDEDYLLELTS